MARIKWTDRRFDFSFPLELYPELLERLRGTPARVTERLEHVAPELRVRRPGQAWSIQEHAGHLADLDESLFLPRVEEYLLGVDCLRAADMTNRATAAANHNASALYEVVARFRGTRSRLLDRLESLDRDSFARVALHPRLGIPMRLVDLVYFQAEHDDYHLTSMTDIVRAGMR